MKKAFFGLALLLAGFTSCNDEVVIDKNTDYAEPGTAVVSLKVQTLGGIKSYADPKRLAANDDEKKIESIAFFVKVGDDETLQCYRSTEDLGSPNGLTEGLKVDDVDKATYTAKFKMSMDGDHNVLFYALTNYEQNNIKPEEITNTTKLKQAVTNAITNNNPVKPLVMLGSAEVINLREGEAKDVEFKVDRLVARVDIVNKAFNTDAGKGFRITSAKVLNGKEQGALLPNSYTQVEAINVIPELAASSKVVYRDGTDADVAEGAAVYQRLDTLYMYENLNGVTFNPDGSIATAPATPDAKATAIRIDGTFNGTPVSQRIEFMKEDQTTGDLSAISIMRNSLYTIQIIPSQDSTSVSFNITVANWNEAVGDTLTIKPTNEKPKLTPIVETSLVGVTKNSNKVYTITDPATLSGTLKFTASGNHDTKVAVKYIGRKNAAWMDGEDAIVKGDLIGYYGSDISREYTIDFSKAVTELSSGANANLPSDAYILIQNTASVKMCDTVLVKFRPNYNSISGAKPVLMPGPDGDPIFWAPMNVGATTYNISTDISASAGDITPACGQLFQWGRKQGFKADKSLTAGSTFPTVTGTYPTQTDLATMETDTKWQNKFILAATSPNNTQGNWLLFESGKDNPAGTGMTDVTAWYQKLWNNGSETSPAKTSTDPCPEGWRVPTRTEWGVFALADKATYGWSKGYITIPGLDGTSLTLPAAGNRSNSSGSSYDQGTGGFYWSASVPSGSVSASNVYFNSGALSPSTGNRAYGFSVRCVQE